MAPIQPTPKEDRAHGPPPSYPSEVTGSGEIGSEHSLPPSKQKKSLLRLPKIDSQDQLAGAHPVLYRQPAFQAWLDPWDGPRRKVKEWREGGRPGHGERFVVVLATDAVSVFAAQVTETTRRRTVCDPTGGARVVGLMHSYDLRASGAFMEKAVAAVRASLGTRSYRILSTLPMVYPAGKRLCLYWELAVMLRGRVRHFVVNAAGHVSEGLRPIRPSSSKAAHPKTCHPCFRQGETALPRNRSTIAGTEVFSPEELPAKKSSSKPGVPTRWGMDDRETRGKFLGSDDAVTPTQMEGEAALHRHHWRGLTSTAEQVEMSINLMRCGNVDLPRYNYGNGPYGADTISIPAWAVTSINERKGVCDELAFVLVSVLRDLQIPSRVVVLRYLSPDDSEPKAHACIEFLDSATSKWCHADPTFELMESPQFYREALGFKDVRWATWSDARDDRNTSASDPRGDNILSQWDDFEVLPSMEGIQREGYSEML